MKIKRTANAGVLLTIDGISILMDGVCEELNPYFGTPEKIRDELLINPPDVVGFTHEHVDHYDAQFASQYEKITKKHILGPQVPQYMQIGGVTINTFLTRHIGKADVQHVSFVLKGSECIWFLGDASPLCLKGLISQLPKPDVLIFPYAYATCESAWNITKSFGAKMNILLHLPKQNCDEYGLWNMVEATTKDDMNIFIPDIGETLEYKI